MLTLVSLGIGQLLAQFVGIHFGNKIVAKHIEKGDFQPEHRLQIMCVGGFILPIGLIVYGWCVEKQTHFILPLVATGFVGFGLLLTFMPASTYLVDVFTIHAASAMAASTVSRSLCAAFIPLSSQKMYAKLGYGWGNTMLGLIATLLIPIPFLFIRYGERIRANSTVKL
jgi:MFS family permease